MSSPGFILGRALTVASTNTGNVYRLTIRCRRCQIVVTRFEGTIEDRASIRAI